MLRQLALLVLSLTLCWTTFACGSPSGMTANQTQVSTPVPPTAPVSNPSLNSGPTNSGEYSLQQAEYDDATGEYTLMLLGSTPPIYRTVDLQMARLTDEELQAGKQSYASINGDQATLHLTEDFKIGYVHNVTKAQVDPQTGQTETVIVRQESNSWSPFASSFAGAAIANSLFAPRYYVPPVYRSGGNLLGYGGYGNSYNGAVDNYRSRYNTPPAAVKNRQVLRTSGAVRSPSSSSSTPKRQTTNRSTGSGVGSSDLRQPFQQTRPSQTTKRRSPSFGSSGTRRRSSGGARRRR
ncbi:MAG: hypothetical protein HC835_01075 [Oscillatoriales cyanobacterium RM2_1_1]|nr:hypothetical protein [Oscillatoriales cyanobacterium RM2_1_1]